MKKTPVLLGCALAAALSAQSANNEPELVYEMAPLVVTGELWKSELQRTTASVTVLDAASFQTDGTGHFEDLVNTIPNLTWTGGTSRPRYLQIRGIGENSQFEGETPDSTVRFLVDDLDFTGIGTIGSLFDVAQVEVLRGPQAGAFGANAAGGVIKIVTKEPTPYWTGQVEGSLGTDDLFGAGLAVGGPLLEDDPERLTFRLAVQQHFSDGFRDNRFLDEDDTNERDELMSRLKLRWKPGPDWQWDATLFYADADNGYDEFSLDNTEFDTYSDQPGRDEQESLAGSIKGRWTGLDAVELTSITTGTTTDSLYSFDGDWTNPDRNPLTYIGFAAIERERNSWSQELRLDSIDQREALGLIDRWTLGAYYQSLEEDTAFAGFGDDFATDYMSDTYSLYGQATHLFSETTRLTLGLRAEHFDLDTDIDNRPDAQFDDTLFGGKLTLEHDLNEDHMAYASVTRGYKAGGANIYPNPAIDDENLETYETETLWNYELGLRGAWLDDRLSTKVTVFYLYRIDPQLRDSEGSGLDFTYITVNGDTARHYGVESEATWHFNRNWRLTAGLGLLETDRASYVDNGNPVDSRELANAPSFTYNLRLDYEADGGFFANAELAGRDEYYESNSHEQKRNAFALVNLAAGYRYENWRLTLWVKNLFDERYEKRVFFFENEGPDYETTRYESPADPRQAGVTLNYSW